MQKLLEINNISKTFNTLNGEINAIKSISFDVNNEQFIAIVGSSGCGKSTLLNIISGLLEKTNGTIKFYKENPIIGYMLQEDALLPYLNILDNATLGLSLKKIKTKENIEYTKRLLETYGLKDGDIVSIQTNGERALIMNNVLVRAGEGNADEVHIDTDEANACNLDSGIMVEIITK